MTTKEMTLADVDLVTPDVYLKGVPHDMYRVLRREAPVYRHWEPDGPGFWPFPRFFDLFFFRFFFFFFAAASAKPWRTSAPPRSAPNVRRRLVAAPRLLARSSNRTSSSGVPPSKVFLPPVRRSSGAT